MPAFPHHDQLLEQLGGREVDFVILDAGSLIDAFLSHSLSVEEIYHQHADVSAATDGSDVAVGQG